MWFLWKRRNTLLHGGSNTTGKVIWEVTDTVKKFLRSRFSLSRENQNRTQIVGVLERYKPSYTNKVVRLFLPLMNWVTAIYMDHIGSILVLVLFLSILRIQKVI